MKVTAPQMGVLEIALEDLARRLGVDFVPAPLSNQQAQEIGSRLGPELACLPLKITLGNFIQGLEKGADTIIMAGGIGPCRFGYYGQIQKLILERAGYKFKLITVEPPSAGLGKFIAAFKELSPDKSTWQLYKIIKQTFSKLRLLDLVEKRTLQLRAYETKRGSTSRVRKAALQIIREAQTKEEVAEAQEVCFQELDKIQVDPERAVLKIGLVGEFYLLLEPFANFDIEEYLGHQGIYVERGVYISDWISPTGKNIVAGISHADIVSLASPYLAHAVGGEGQLTIGHVVHFAKESFDGIIHLFPFTCMPEIIADNIMPKVLKKHEVPVLTLVIDEQSGRSGQITRLEAFIDLMKSKVAALPRPDKPGLAMTSLRGSSRPKQSPAEGVTR